MIDSKNQREALASTFNDLEIAHRHIDKVFQVISVHFGVNLDWNIVDDSSHEIVKTIYNIVNRDASDSFTPDWTNVAIDHFMEAIKEFDSSCKNLDYYNPEYRKLRHEVFIRDGEECAKCGNKPPKFIMHIDHIKPVSKYPDLFLNKDNMQVLCAECNLDKSNKNEIDYRNKNG